MDLDPVRLKVLKLVKNRKPATDMKAASIAMGRNAAYLHQFVYRGTPKVLSEDDREALAEHLGCKAEDLKHKKVPPRKPRRKAAPKEGRVEPSIVATAPEGYMAIPEIDVRASAGPGALNQGLEETKEMWFFPDPVIRHEFRARPADLRMITIDGDSMEPLLASGDRILIDTSQRVPVPPGIFVIWDGMGLVAKRIEHEPNSEPPKVVIKSVNPEYDTYERDAEEVHIIGRVVWTSRRL
jgi:phage repressor protein C with HTH and peptisase S24 domain